MSTWRDRIKVHPAADMFPMIPDAELDELAADIKENGLRNGVTLWTPEKWEDYWNKGNKWPKTVFLLDGRNRLEALQRAYSDDDPDKAIDAALSTNSRDLDLVGATLLWGDRTDPYAYVVSANLHRRHLNSEGRRNLITQ